MVTEATKPSSVVHTAPEGTRPWDFLWSITAWGAELLDERLVERIERLQLTDEMLDRIDRLERPHYRIERRRLATGALFLQYRFLFGPWRRGDRAAIDTPLAQQAGLRWTNLLFRQ